MSQETMETLNTKVLVGFGQQAWHNRPELKTEGENHYPGAIPVEDVLKRLFNFDGVCKPVYTMTSTGEVFQIEGQISVVPSDGRAISFGIHSDGYQPHQYATWLIENISKLISDHAGIGTAGLLKKGAQAWVQIEVPETYKTVQGVDFRSYLLAATSFDGKVSTIYKLCNQLTVCDNTREIALNEKSLNFRVKHTKNSELRIHDAQAALHLIEQEQEAFASEVDALCDWKVTDAQFEQFMSKLVPLPEKKELDINKRDYSTRTATIAANKREKLNELYRADGRVAPWKGTAFGVLQMVNTYTQHLATQRKADSRYLRNMENVINGSLAENDLDAMLLLSKITGRELVAA